MTASSTHPVAVLIVMLGAALTRAAPTLAADTAATIVGPAMGTTWRVTLSGPVAGMTTAAIHREIESVLARIDRAASTWRDDSDVGRFNRAAAGEWVEMSPDLAAIVGLAGRIHDESTGAFDITVAPLVKLWRAGGPPSDAELAAAETCVGMRFLEVRPAEGDGPPEIRKTRAGVELDLDGIAPGYAVDQIGARLAALGSAGHLVELGGEVRAWGLRSDGEPWRVALHPAGLDRREARVIELSAGMALATSTIRPGGGAIDPRTGRRVERSEQSATVLAESCAEADAWAVAAVVLGLEADDRGLVTPEALPKK